MIISILPHPFRGLCCFEEEKLCHLDIGWGILVERYCLRGIGRGMLVKESSRCYSRKKANWRAINIIVNSFDSKGAWNGILGLHAYLTGAVGLKKSPKHSPSNHIWAQLWLRGTKKLNFGRVANPSGEQPSFCIWSAGTLWGARGDRSFIVWVLYESLWSVGVVKNNEKTLTSEILTLSFTVIRMERFIICGVFVGF